MYALPNSPTKRVGGTVIDKFKKITHSIPMLSIPDVFFSSILPCINVSKSSSSNEKTEGWKTKKFIETHLQEFTNEGIYPKDLWE